MIEIVEMAKGLAMLGIAFNREITPELAEVYHGVLGAKLDPTGWERAVRRSLEAERYFPPPAVLLKYGAAERPTHARAAEVYDVILGCYEGGVRMGPRDVRDRFGEAAMDAFLAAGGVAAFEWCDTRDQPFRRKSFLEAWSEAVEVEPAKALPPGRNQELLHD